MRLAKRPSMSSTSDVGGSSSGKTYNVLDMLLYRMCTEQNLVITITGPNFPALKRGCIRDTISIWSNDPLYKATITQPNQNGCKCESTGSVLEFAVFYNIEVAKGAKRDILFINEITAMPEEICFELFARTKKNAIIDFNPNCRFWIHDRFECYKDASWIYSTHKANHFLPQTVHDEIESWKETDPERYRVYGLGKCGKVDGLVYQKWSQIDGLPEEYRWRVFGLDFGFANDPTALIEIRYVNGELYVKEHIYKTGLTNPDIANIIKELGFQNETIICDSAELKSIEELRRLGIINAKPAIKGAGSIMQGISLINSMNMFVDKSSNNLKSELMNYKWDTDAVGHSVNKPIDKFNHLSDSIRYAVSYKFNRPNTKSRLGGF